MVDALAPAAVHKIGAVWPAEVARRPRLRWAIQIMDLAPPCRACPGGIAARPLTAQGTSCDWTCWAAGEPSEPEWRNGRLGGLKSPFPRGSVGSSPTSGTASNL